MPLPPLTFISPYASPPFSARFQISNFPSLLHCPHSEGHFNLDVMIASSVSDTYHISYEKVFLPTHLVSLLEALPVSPGEGEGKRSMLGNSSAYQRFLYKTVLKTVDWIASNANTFVSSESKARLQVVPWESLCGNLW